MSKTFKLKGSSHTFSPFDGPLEGDRAAPFFAAYGYAIAAFSRLEFMVTMLMVHMNKESDNPALHDARPPRNYSEQVRLLEKWISLHPAHESFRTPEDESFFDNLVKYAEIRNQLVHGFVEQIDPDTGNFITHWFKPTGKDQWVLVREEFTPLMLEHVASQAILAARHFNEIAVHLFEEYFEDTPDGLFEQ